jgi:hypothetical protein
MICPGLRYEPLMFPGLCYEPLMIPGLLPDSSLLPKFETRTRCYAVSVEMIRSLLARADHLLPAPEVLAFWGM